MIQTLVVECSTIILVHKWVEIEQPSCWFTIASFVATFYLDCHMTVDVTHMILDTRPSRFSACNIEKLGRAWRWGWLNFHTDNWCRRVCKLNNHVIICTGLLWDHVTICINWIMWWYARRRNMSPDPFPLQRVGSGNETNNLLVTF